MNAVNLTGLKVTMCGVAALTLSLAVGWTFVESSSVLQMAAGSSHMAVSAAAQSATRLAQSAATGLLQ